MINNQFGVIEFVSNLLFSPSLQKIPKLRVCTTSCATEAIYIAFKKLNEVLK